jgi:hypothetical protein
MINCCGEQKAFMRGAYSAAAPSVICCHFCTSCGVAQIVTMGGVAYDRNGSCESVYLLQLFAQGGTVW